MKTQLAILAAVVVGTSAWADGGGRGGGGGHHGPDICDVCDHDIVIKGPQIQSTSLHNSFSVASAKDDSFANNNMSSNTKGVLIKAKSEQTTNLNGTGVLAMASEYGFAQNNLASNIGSVAVAANQQQTVTTSGLSYIGAYSNDHSTAVQNFSTNNACLDCNPHARRGPRPN